MENIGPNTSVSYMCAWQIILEMDAKMQLFLHIFVFYYLSFHKMYRYAASDISYTIFMILQASHIKTKTVRACKDTFPD